MTLEQVRKVRGTLKNRKEKGEQGTGEAGEGEACLGSGQGPTIRQ